MRNQGRGKGRGLKQGSTFQNGFRRGAGNGFGRGLGRKMMNDSDDSLLRMEDVVQGRRRRVMRNDGSCLSEGPGFGKGLGRGNGQNRKHIK
ncbi:MAG: hypothetical protein ABXS92_04915 [Sulfurimonas sp.]